MIDLYYSFVDGVARSVGMSPEELYPVDSYQYRVMKWMEKMYLADVIRLRSWGGHTQPYFGCAL